MREVVQSAWETYKLFNGTGMHMVLFLGCALLLGGLSKSNKEKSHAFLLSGYTACFFLIFFCPLTAKIIMDYCVGADVYWRMFWILPLPIVIAYAFSLRLKAGEGRFRRCLCAACMFVVIAVTGTVVYQLEPFVEAQNPYKLPQEVIDVCDMINEDAGDNSIEEKKAVVVNELVPYIRQYDGSIKMPYGRNATRGLGRRSKNCRRLYELMNSTEVNFKKLAKYAKKEECNYLVYYKNGFADEALRDLGHERIGESDSYYIYRLKG